MTVFVGQLFLVHHLEFVMVISCSASSNCDDIDIVVNSDVIRRNKA